MSMDHLAAGLAAGRLRMDDPPKRARELAGTVFPPRETVIGASHQSPKAAGRDPANFGPAETLISEPF
jgi:hypothetical protein